MKQIDRITTALPILLSCIIIVFGIFGNASTVPFFVNSDSLQPTQMAWDMTRHAYAVPNFQWSRVPSLPDVAFFFLMEWVSINWRTAFLLYTCLIALAAILSLGWVVARMRGSSYREGVFWAGIAVTFTLASTLAVIAVSPDEALQRIPQAILFICNSHGDAFLISVIVSCTALGAIRGNKKQAWITWALCALATASDTMFIGYFLMPYSVATTIVTLRHRRTAEASPLQNWPSFKAAFRFLCFTGLACLVGWIAKLPLPMQAMRMEFPGLDAAAIKMLRELPQLPWVAGLLILTLFLAARAARIFCRPVGNRAASDLEVDREMLLLIGLAASLMSLGLTLLLYIDSGVYRYAMPLFWWPLAIGLGLIRVHSRRISVGAAAIAMLATAFLPLSASALPRYHTPLERCLSDHRNEWGLKAGLATYWNSRITMVSSDWTLQVDQIHDTGDAYLWGNNIVSYKHDMHAPQRPPEYNFVVIDETSSPFDLETNFGPAPRVETCGDFQVWIYDQPIVPPGIDWRPPSFPVLEFIPK